MAKLKQGELKDVFGDSEDLHQAVSKAEDEYLKLQDQKKKVADAKDVVMEEMKKVKKERLPFRGLIYKRKKGAEHLSITKQPNKE